MTLHQLWSQFELPGTGILEVQTTSPL